ncbi:MAG: imidazole glycerol phosphate synthase cyclase subunit [Proteobacteria bacterium]|nr:imidazole glycerol phosphate synthase cyclase subunit [Pseudomonadota bacterium]
MTVRLRLIPSLLLRRERLVKGVRYGSHRDAGHPVGTARAHNAQGADEIMLVDIDAAREGRGPDLEMLRAVAAVTFIPITVAGGITSADSARACIANGADKVMITTAALDRPSLINELARTLGVQATVLGIDLIRAADQRLQLYDHRRNAAILDRDWRDLVREAVERGAGELRVMAVDREGTRQGLDLEIHAEIAALARVPMILEGGAGTLKHLHEAFQNGVLAIGLGTMLVFSDNNIFKLKQYLGAQGHLVRRLESA